MAKANKRTVDALADPPVLSVSDHPYTHANGIYEQMQGEINGRVWYRKKKVKTMKKREDMTYFWFYDKKSTTAVDSWNFR